MLCKPLYLLVAFAVISVTATKWNEPERGDHIQGELSRNSVVIFSGPFVGPSFEWRGHNMITRFEVLDRSFNGSLFDVEIRGGLEENFLQIWSDDGRPINALVRIFSEPRNEEFGWRRFDSVLVNTTRVTGFAPLDVTITGAFFIHYVEFEDRTNGTGIIANVQGLDTNRLTAQFRSTLFRDRVDYIVRFYGKPTTPNHHEVGQLTSSSVLIGSQIITSADLSWWGQFKFRHDNHTFDYARLTDLSNGTGGEVLRAESFSDILEIQFDTQFDNLAFLLEVYGTPRPPSNLIIGELQPGSVLLVEKIVSEWGPRAVVVLQTEHPIDRIEVLNQGWNSRVRPTLLTGELGGRVVAVVFESDEFEAIDYVVRIFGRRPWFDLE